MNQQPGAPKSAEQLEYERLLAEYQTKKQQLERKAQMTKRQLQATMKECEEQIAGYQERIRKMDELLQKVATAPKSFLREITRERLEASREVYAAGLRMSEIQMHDHKANHDAMDNPAALELSVTDSTGSYEYRLAKARNSFASAKLTLLDYKKPLEVLEYVITTEMDHLGEVAEPAPEEPVVEAAPEPAPEAVTETGEEQVNLDDAIRELLGDVGEVAPVLSTVVPKAVPKDRPKAWEGMSLEVLQTLKEYIENHPPVKNELVIAFPYYQEAVELFDEAELSLAQLNKTSNAALLKQLAQDGDNLLGKIKGKVFYLTRLPELMAPYTEIAEMLPPPEPVQDESKRPTRTATAPLPGTNTLKAPEKKPEAPTP